MNPLFAKIATTTATTVTVSAIAWVQAAPVGAASFNPLVFETQFTTSGVFDPSQDIRLDSVDFNDRRVNQFSLVEEVNIISNQGNILTAARGINAVEDSLVEEGPATGNPTEADLAAALGNLNLNSIVNSRESEGEAVLDIFFNNPVSTFFFWEWGGAPGSSVTGNSSFLVEALTDDGSEVLASFRILSSDWSPAGFTMQSTIPSQAVQNVGSLGLELVGARSSRLRLSYANPVDAGPDFKVAAAPIPEPSTLLSSFALGSLLIWRKRF